MAVLVRHSAWSARPGHRVLLRQQGPLGRPLLWVPLVPGGPRVNEAADNETADAAITYSNLTVDTGLAVQGGGFYDFNGTSSAATFTNPAGLTASTPVTMTWLQRYDTQSNSYPFVSSIYFSSITAFVCFQAPTDSGYYFVAGVAGSNTPSFSAGHGAPVVGRVNRYVLTASNGLGATGGITMWRDGVRFTSPGTIATSDGLTGSSKIGGRTSDSTFNWSGVIADYGIFAGIASDAAIRQFFDRPYDTLYEPRRIWVPVSAGGGAAEIGLATETDTALALTAAQRLGVGQAQETDSALPLTSAQALAIGQALEQDTALPIGSSQTLAIGQAIEQDIAQPLGSGTVVAIGQAVESDSAQPLASQQSLAIGQASETDTAQPLDVVAGGFLGIAIEQDIAQPLTAAQRLAIGQAQESDTALALLAGQGKAIGLALEADTALPVQGLLGLGLAQEQDTALPLIAPPPPPPPPATESETTAGYRRNPRTPRDLDPLPAEDLADQVRDKWDAIERANEAVRRARRGPPPAAVVAPTQAPAPKPRQRRASAAELSAVAGGVGLQLTPEQLADEEAFILLVAELV